MECRYRRHVDCAAKDLLALAHKYMDLGIHLTRKVMKRPLRQFMTDESVDDASISIADEQETTRCMRACKH